MTNISTATPAELRQTVRNMRAENLDVSTQLDLIHADVIDAEPITCRHNGGRIDPHHVTTIRAGRLMMRCLAKNAARTAAKLRSASRAPARRIASVSRSYPKFAPGMSTAEYVKAFADFNNSANPAHVLPYDLSAYLNPCTLYEGGDIDFEPIEQPIDAPDLAADEPQPVAIVSALTGATLATVPRHVADQVSELIAEDTTSTEAARQVSELIASATTAALEKDAAAALQMHGKDWDGRDVSGWYVSEKLDGCRAYWNGFRLYTKTGNTIHAPSITANLPAGFALDGELWAGRGQFETARQFVQYGKHAESVQFVAFDAPSAAGDWPDRLEAARATGVQCVDAGIIADHGELEQLLKATLAIDGEGLMVRAPGHGYTAGRSTNLLKIKAHSLTYFAADDDTSAARQVSELIASATTAAAIEQASETSTTQATEPDQVPELATVDACSESSASATTCDASSASGSHNAPPHGRASSNRGKSIVERRADAVLSKEVRDSETGTVMTRAQWVEWRVNDGARPSIEMVDKIKPMSRTQFNRASNAEQRAHEAKIKAGGKVPEYSLGDYIVSKTEYDYAQKLIAESATKDQAQSVQVEPPPDECEPDPAPELATVGACSESSASATTCDASSAGNAPSAPQNGRVSSAQHQAPTKPTHDAHGQRIGQRVAGRSGHWCAVMFTDPDGRPSFEFDGPGGLIEVLTFTTGRERMATLQAMARQADQAAQTGNDDETERERRLNAFDAMTATAADVQAMGSEYVAQLLDDLEDINYHTEGLILQALAAGREDLAARARANLREHLAAGYLTDALRLDRQAISEALRQSTEPDPTHPAGDTPSSDPTSAQGYAPPAPDAHQQTAPVPNLADKVPRAVGADSGPASNPPGATAPSAPAPSAPAPSAPAPDTEASADEPEPEFTRAAPQPFDMLAMIAAGLAPDDFVGLGIVYSGDSANPSGRGAITDVQPCSWYKYTITVTLEDGRQSRLNPVSFTEHLGNRYKNDFKRHGAPYLAELAAARLAVEAADKAAKQAAADDKARQRRELPQQWPQLKAYDPAGKLNGPTLAAHNIRVLLKERFPKMKFSVKSDRYAGGDSIDIRWTDGPNTKAVEKIADQFEAGSFNGQEDIYEYAHSVFRDLFGDAKYIHCHRDISDALLSQAIAAEYPNAESRPTVEDYRKARGAFSYEHRNEWAARRIRERLESMGAGLPS